MIVLDEKGGVIRPALLWNDIRSSPQAAALAAELGGPAAWAERTGSVPTMSFTVAKLRWLAEHEPENVARAERVLLPHDWLTWRLGGGPGSGTLPTTDRGDASGTGYFSPTRGAWLPDILLHALGHDAVLPRVAGPSEAVGQAGWGALLSAGTGDNMGAALGLGLGPGDMAISIGTSGTAYLASPKPVADPSGAVAGFADATGHFMPLACTVNAAMVLDVTARMLGTDAAGLADRALAASPGAGGLVLLPYLDGERTPNRPAANGVLRGLTTRNSTPENLARAAVEAVLCSLADAADAVAASVVAAPRRIILTGGAARSAAIRAIAPAIFGLPVTVPEPAEDVALGAARQAAWAPAAQEEAGPRLPRGPHAGPAHMRRTRSPRPGALRRPARRHRGLAVLKTPPPVPEAGAVLPARLARGVGEWWQRLRDHRCGCELTKQAVDVYPAAAHRVQPAQGQRPDGFQDRRVRSARWAIGVVHGVAEQGTACRVG
jgi:xylulokinase